MLEITFLGNSAFVISSETTTVVVDPYIEDNDECPLQIAELVDAEQPDAVCVTHAAFDHVGDTLALATNHNLPVITEPATAHYLLANGMPESEITRLLWGMSGFLGDLTIRALESRHASIRTVEGGLISGLPLSLLFSSGDTTAYHLGDTSIFSDLELFGDLYEPDVTMVGVGQAYDASSEGGEVTRSINELSTREAMLVSQWIGSDQIVPMHYLPKERDRFISRMESSDSSAEVVPLDPGESLTVE